VSLCGTLVSADQQRLRIQVAGQQAAESIGLPAVQNLRVVAAC